MLLYSSFRNLYFTRVFHILDDFLLSLPTLGHKYQYVLALTLKKTSLFLITIEEITLVVVIKSVNIQ